MTKRDYQALARAIHGTMPNVWPDAPVNNVWRATRDAVADVLAADNPRFNRELFREACETGRTKGMPR